jgi:urease accessory protein
MKRILFWATLLQVGLAPTLVFAHTGHGDTNGFIHGFMHPIGGLDHMLAMVLIGVFAYQLGRNAMWLVPTAFLVLMAVGGLAGVSGIPIPFVEIGIALSVVALGMAVALDAKWPVALAMTVVGLFAIFHGHAHGSEMHTAFSPSAYGTGFVLATACLHILGIAVGALISRAAREDHAVQIYRLAGGCTAVLGTVLLASSS